MPTFPSQVLKAGEVLLVFPPEGTPDRQMVELNRMAGKSAGRVVVLAPMPEPGTAEPPPAPFVQLAPGDLLGPEAARKVGQAVADALKAARPARCAKCDHLESEHTGRPTAVNQPTACSRNRSAGHRVKCWCAEYDPGA